MNRHIVLVAAFIVSAAVGEYSRARADIIAYTLPGSDLELMFQGRTKVLAGGSVNFTHPVFGSVIFKLEEIKIYKAPTTNELFSRELGRAKDAPAAIEAAKWALHHGLLGEFQKAVDKARELDPQNQDAQRLVALRKSLDVDLGDSKAEEEQLREKIRNRGMKISKSKHFIMLHDTPDKPPEGEKETRAEKRLELLENVYESFMLKFFAQGTELDIPKERLMVVLFNHHDDYLDYARSQSESLTSASGFWEKTSNIAFFYDHGTTKTFQKLQELSDEIADVRKEAVRERASNAAEIRRLDDVLRLLIQVEQENSDITVVSHEATHQMAGNTGLLPRHVQIPSWVHEGLATYFESPKDAAWSGIGAVNEERLSMYKVLAENDREHSNIEFIAGDQIFKYAATRGSTLHGYGQAWALTHFLMDRHFDDLMTYYRRLGELPPDITFSPAYLNKLFDSVFKGNRRALDGEWRSYMRGLKTDVQEITGKN